MKIVVGLGNPGKEYEKTRHNVGFIFVEALANCREITPLDGIKFLMEKKFESEIAEVTSDGEKLILVKPQTFMNSSGRAVSKVMQFYKADISDLIVVNDDIDLPVGVLRIREDGSSAGQKGLQNIIDELGSDRFLRFRIGVGRHVDPENKIEAANFVLSKIDKRDMPIIEQVIEEGINYFVQYFGKKEPIPGHTIEVVPKEDRIEE